MIPTSAGYIRRCLRSDEEAHADALFPLPSDLGMVYDDSSLRFQNKERRTLDLLDFSSVIHSGVCTLAYTNFTKCRRQYTRTHSMGIAPCKSEPHLSHSSSHHRASFSYHMSTDRVSIIQSTLYTLCACSCTRVPSYRSKPFLSHCFSVFVLFFPDTQTLSLRSIACEQS